MNLTPTPEFLEAFRRVTGSDDTSPRTVLPVIREHASLLREVRRVHAEIMKAKAAAANAAVFAEFARKCGCE
jgi:hypothetical protein